MHLLTKNKVYISKDIQKKIINILEIIKKGPLKMVPLHYYFENIFNDIDSNSLTFLMYLISFEQQELFVEIYLKYKQYINLLYLIGIMKIFFI